MAKSNPSAPSKAPATRKTKAGLSDDRVIAPGKWYVHSRAARRAGDLPFTRMGPPRPELNGTSIMDCWWDVTPAKTDYCHVHWTHGRAHAFEVIDALRNPDGHVEPGQLGHILSSMLDWARTSGHSVEAMKGIAYGFGSVLGEYIQWHRANR